jgi:ABC-type oligopeptide transport system ATPase subunit
VIVEFIGASGSGKTSLARNVVRSLEETHDAVMASDLVLRQLRLEEVSAPTARNVVADLSAVVEMLRLTGEQRTFLPYALRMLNRHRPRSFQTLNYVRSVVRRLGVDGIARRRGRHMVVLVDEGVLLVAYLLFVYGNTGFHEDDLAEFAGIAPLPDRIVHVKAPLESLVRRTLSRLDPPRELRARDKETVTRFLGSAADMFAQLVTTPPLRDRVLEVENLGGAARQQELATGIADSIRTLRQPANSTIPKAMADSRKEA